MPKIKKGMGNGSPESIQTRAVRKPMKGGMPVTANNKGKKSMGILGGDMKSGKVGSR